MTDRPLSYWVTVARMGFENDFNRLFDELGLSRTELARRMDCTPAYVSKLLNGTAGNFQLETMAKWARAIDAIVQIRLIKEGAEVVRVMDYESARALDDKSPSHRTAQAENRRPSTPLEISANPAPGSNLLRFPDVSTGQQIFKVVAEA